MFSYCCNAKSDIEKDVDYLKTRIEEMKKQINNIYELLEALTNESKHIDKSKFYLDKNNVK